MQISAALELVPDPLTAFADIHQFGGEPHRLHEYPGWKYQPRLHSENRK
jgi:hypothetical protein